MDGLDERGLVPGGASGGSPIAATQRPVIESGPFITIKRHLSPEDAEREARWFRKVPWAAPHLLDVCGSTLVMQTLPSCWYLPTWRPVQELHELIMKLFAEGIHHRDVHPGNIVCGLDGKPRLIDWETAIQQKADAPYDLVGRASGVPDPDRHLKAAYSQWWESSSLCSIEKVWGVGVPTRPDPGVSAPVDRRRNRRRRKAVLRGPVSDDREAPEGS